MKRFSLRFLGVIVVALGISVSAINPAQAANISMTLVTNPANTAFATSTGTPAFTVTIPGASISSLINYISIGGSLSGNNWTPVNTCPAYSGSLPANNLASCGITSIKVGGITVSGWQAYLGGVTYNGIRVYNPSTQFSPTTGDIEITFAQGAFVTPATNGYYTFGVATEEGSGNLIDRGTSTILVGTAPTVTVDFNANSGSGTMSPQSSNVSASLTSNTFTRSGYTFSGWNTAANGSGTAFADGATYNFQSSRILYAQWTANSSGSGSSSTSAQPLANTGINTASGISLLTGGLSLALVGAELFMIARRERSN
ncbi:InlB B-repeat-containing protein [Aurantimicrobium minutum]|uniref:InlB B-repeat-containing protein n=1 Tax=Aurantimicrobium minutum TaxID=708131 RepID=UPI0024754715|nr:InlB B-repeat-containing protein [Aurantimicrobium minutum]MDH6423109.1 putative repeat protein (TIGR02543 family) [Aurantimicrobium minutum]